MEHALNVTGMAKCLIGITTMIDTIEQLIADGPRSNETARETADKIVKALADAVTLDWYQTAICGWAAHFYDVYENKAGGWTMDDGMAVSPHSSEEEAKAAALSHYRAQCLKPFGLEDAE